MLHVLLTSNKFFLKEHPKLLTLNCNFECSAFVRQHTSSINKEAQSWLEKKILNTSFKSIEATEIAQPLGKPEVHALVSR